MKAVQQAMCSVRWAFNSHQWHPTILDWTRAAQCIQHEEKERIGKFIFQRDAKSSMIGRLMMRRLLHRFTKIPYDKIQLGRTEKGKPCLMNDIHDDHISFNVSHQGEYVVLAAETKFEVGVDVMNPESPVGSKSVPEFFKLMRRQFTDDEWRTIRSSANEKEQLKTFYRLWCLKESYVKALGIGIGYEVKRLSFNIVDPLDKHSECVCSTTLKVDDEDAHSWRFEETFLDNHCIAVALKQWANAKSEWISSPRFSVLSFEELLQDSKPLSDPDEEYARLFINKDQDPFTARPKNKCVA